MDYAQLVIDLNNIGVTVPDIRRASLYYDYLVDARTYFHTTLNAARAAGVGATTYTFVSPALRDVTLLNQLAKILDFYVAPAVENALKYEYANGHGEHSLAPWNYADYFDNRILDANPVTYAANVQTFRTTFPISAHAIQHLADNFKRNIKRCCERAHDDLVNLTLFFQDQFNNRLTIDRLTHIKSSGSDFHKGGGQVLILTFAIRYVAQGSTTQTAAEFKIVYKPGDLEADCLLTGDSAAVNNVIPNFMVNSLAEIYNQQVDANPLVEAIKLRIYRILPMVYNSAHGAGAPLPIPDAYGYIEYLNNDLQWGTSEWFGYYPGATSDFVIFGFQNRYRIINDFYQRAGAYCALFSAFSVTDIHVENFRVCRYDPYPIDMEISLTTAIDDIRTTVLIDAGFGALNRTDAPSEVWNIENETVAGKSKLVRDTVHEPCANRLYDAQSNQQKTLIDIDNLELFEGYEKAMQILRAGQTATAFNAWFTRLSNNVVVRHLTFGTGTFKAVMEQIYINELELGRGRNLALQTLLDRKMLEQRTIQFDTYVGGTLPDFVSFLDTEAAVDYLAMDIPVYYYRINGGQVELYNSRGAVVTIPVNIQIIQQGNPVNVPCRAVVTRATFFPNEPTATVVRAPQVTALGNPVTYGQRFNLIQQSMLDRLGLDAVPQRPQIIIPFDFV